MATKRIIYEYPLPLLSGRLSRRYKRFFADVFFDSHEPDTTAAKGDDSVAQGATTTHCPNTGSLATLLAPFNDESPQVLCSTSDNAKRKFKYTLEAIYQHKSDSWVGLHSAYANRLVKSCLQKGWIEELRGFSELKEEVKVSGGLGNGEAVGKKRKKSDDGAGKKLDDSRIDFQLIWGAGDVGDGTVAEVASGGGGGVGGGGGGEERNRGGGGGL